MLSNAAHATPSVCLWMLSMPRLLCTNGSRHVLYMLRCAVQRSCTGWAAAPEGMLAAMRQQADCSRPSVQSACSMFTDSLSWHSWP